MPLDSLTPRLDRRGFSETRESLRWLAIREASPGDRRAWIVRLTPKGRRAFDAMARQHEQWILELFAGLDAKTVQQLYTQLGALRVQLVRTEPPPEEKA